MSCIVTGGKIISVAEWNKWLADLTDYVLSVKKQSKVFPKRVVLTNGHWLILFNDPENAFTQKNLCDPRHIRIYSEPQALIDQAADLYRSLEHQTVLGEVPHLQTGELPFYVPAGAVDRLMHGLHVIHNETTTFEEAAPVIYVRPILLARSGTGAWICIKATDSFPLPDRAKDLAEHLAKVDSCAKALFADVVRALALPETTTCASLVSHYKTDDNVRMLPGFREIRSLATGLSRQFLILTGEHTHYLLSSPTVADCPFHEWSTCARNHTAAGTRPILVKTTVPHSFFVSGTDHHCAHMQVYRAKASPVLADNRSYTGPRSAEDGGAFCELWPLEQYLCCRSCVFQNVCTASSLFHLPCSRVL